MLKIATVCSGIGAPEAAWSPLGFQFIFSSEIEPFPCAVLQHHYPHVPNLGDMTKFQDWPDRCDCPKPILAPFEFTIGGNTLKIYVCTKCRGITIDVLVGGTPCQSFSVAGLRKGLSDTRGNLALVFLAIVRKYRPTWVVWENVPGVHSSWTDDTTHPATETACDPIAKALRALRQSGLDPGPDFGPGQFEECDQTNDFDCFLAGLAELQYGLATKIYDAQYFGVAQRRRRVFVIGHIGRQWQRAAAVLFERESLRGNPPPRRQTRESPSGRAPEGIRISGEAISKSLRGNTGGIDREDCHTVIPINMQCAAKNGPTTPHGVGIGNPGDPANTLGANDRHAIAFVASTTGNGFWSEGVGTLRAREQESHEHLITHTLKAEGFDATEDGTGRGTPLVPVTSGPVLHNGRAAGSATGQDAECGLLIPEIAYALQERDSKGSDSKGSDSNTKDGHLIPVENTRQKQYSEASIQCSEEEPIAFPGTLSGTQRIKTENLSPSIGSANPTAVTQRMAVRRLTPRECERLQGFPDDYTLLPGRTADGPRYKALGNSMAVPNIRWIGARIEQVHSIKS